MGEAVWVVDDCPMTTKIARVRLRALGAEGHFLPSGRAAIGAWTIGSLPKPSAMLVDPSMQSGDGIDACRFLRDAGFTGLLLLHTNAASAAAVQDAAGLPFDGVIIKPANAADYASVIERVRASQRRRSA